MNIFGRLRGKFLSCEEEGAGGLSPVKSDDDAGREFARRMSIIFIGDAR